METAQPHAPDILAGLKKAASGSYPLQAPSGGGIFPGGAKGKELAERAVRDGLLTKREEKVKTGSRTKTVVYGAITEKGLLALAEQNSPKDALDALRPAVEKLGTPPTPADPQAFSAALEKATATCVNAITDVFAGLRDEVLRAVAPSRDTVDAAPVLAALSTALGRVEPVVVKVPAPSEPSAHAPKPDDGEAVAREIVSFVSEWAREKTVGPPFDAIMRHLRAKHAQLTIGAFHDALRRLSAAGSPSIKLSGWSKTIHELPDPELALFVKHTLTYYAHPSH